LSRQINHEILTDVARTFLHQSVTHAGDKIAKDNIKKQDNIRVVFSKFRRKVAIVSLRSNLLRFHLSGIFMKQLDVSQQYEPDRTLYPGTLCWHIAQKHIMPPFAETLNETGRDASESGMRCESFRNSKTRLFQPVGNKSLR